MKAIISGGGSGGHIFPAVAIANAIKRRWSDAEILFVGAEGRMEMEKVPAAGYEIKGLPIAGLQRKLSLSNIAKNAMLPYKVIKSRLMVRGIIKKFNPDIVVGVGGFASEPTLKTAASMGYTTIIQEQNSYAGLTNKTLARSAAKICVAYDKMERFFPKDRIVFTGNPVRKEIEELAVTREDGCKQFNLKQTERVVLSVGGSLGARSINEMIINNLDYFKSNKIQLIWQTGKWMFQEAKKAVGDKQASEWVKVHEFISRMDCAYAAADAVISRAGAIAISELCLVGKPILLIPSPNVAEDHQTKNAMSLVCKGAAEMVSDKECATKGIKVIDEILNNEEMRTSMSANIKKLGVHHSADLIVDEIAKLVEK